MQDSSRQAEEQKGFAWTEGKTVLSVVENQVGWDWKLSYNPWRTYHTDATAENSKG